MSANYDGLTKNTWPGTWAPSASQPIVLDVEIRGALRFVSGEIGDRLEDITGQRLQSGMLVYLRDSYDSFVGGTYYKYDLLGGEVRDEATGAMPNAAGNWSPTTVKIDDGTTFNLAELDDAAISSPVNENDLLLYSGGQWINATIGIDNLNDVNIGSPLSDRFILVYDAATQKWIAVDPDTLTELATSIGDLADVELSSPIEDRFVLAYDSATQQWKVTEPSFSNFIEVLADGPLTSGQLVYLTSEGKAKSIDGTQVISGNSTLVTTKNPFGSPADTQTFGFSSDIFSNYYVISDYRAVNGSQTEAGKIYIYETSTGTLLQEIFSPNVANGSRFGQSVTTNGINVAASSNVNEEVYIFSATTGQLLNTITNPIVGDTGNSFGTSIQMRGNYIIVGSPNSAEPGYIESGAVHIFNATTGGLVHTLTNPNPQDQATFGFSVALTPSTEYAIVGDFETRNSAGYVYIFDVATGSLVHTLSNDLNDLELGYKVTASDLYVATWNRGPNDLSGAVDIFEISSGQLLRRIDNPNTLYSPSGTDDQFGRRTLSIFENYILVGADFEDPGNATNSGAAYLLDIPSGTVLDSITTPSGGTSGAFGYSGGIYSDFILIGQPFSPLNDGRAFVFDYSSITVTTKATDWIGIADTNYADGDLAKIITTSGVSDSFTNLIIANKYFITLDGQLFGNTTQYGQVGVAISSDSILLTASSSTSSSTGSGGGPGGNVNSINDLQDVDTATTTPSNGDTLVWDAINGVWEPSTPVVTLEGLQDVVVGSPLSIKDLIYYDGNDWVNGSINLNDLGNVNTSLLQNGQVLKYDTNTNNWINGSVLLSLNNLTDVGTNGVTDGQALVYDGNSGNWLPGTVATPVNNLDDLGDVTVAGATNGQVLEYNATASPPQWEATTLNFSTVVNINDLGDVDTAGVANNKALVYIAANSRWEPVTVGFSNVSLINDLTDVDTSGVTFGQALLYDNVQAKWFPGNVGSSNVSVISDLTDVDTSGVTNGQGLAYNNTNSAWEPIDLTTVSNITDLSDVSVAGATDGQVLTYNSTAGEWQALDPAAPVQVYANYASFPASGNLGDLAFANDIDHLYVWEGTIWRDITRANVFYIVRGGTFTGPLTGSQVFEPQQTITLTELYAQVDTPSGASLIFAVMKNGVELQQFVIPTPLTTVTGAFTANSITTADDITVDIISGSGTNLVVKISYET